MKENINISHHMKLSPKNEILTHMYSMTLSNIMKTSASMLDGFNKNSIIESISDFDFELLTTC